MAYLKDITKKEFVNLAWFVSEINVSVTNIENGKCTAWGNVFFKLDSDRNKTEDTENLSALWLDYNATVSQAENNSFIINIDPLEDDDFETNLISFCKQDLHQAKQLVRAACAATQWEKQISSAIQEHL